MGIFDIKTLDKGVKVRVNCSRVPILGGTDKQIWRVKCLYLSYNLSHVLAFLGENLRIFEGISPLTALK